MVEKKKRRVVLVFVLLAAILMLWGGEKATAGNIPDLALMTATPGGSWYPIAGAMAEAIQKHNPKTRIDVIQGGGRINPTAVNDKKGDFGIAMAVTCVDALNQQGEYAKKKAHTNIRTLVNLYEGVYQLCTLKDSDIHTIADIRGKRMMVGPQGSATVTFSRHALSTAGITFDDLKKADYVSASNGATMLKDRVVDVFTTGIGGYPIAAIQDVAASREVRLISFSDEAIGKLQKINAGYLKKTIPGGVYNGQDEDVQTFGGVTMLIVRADLADETVEQMLTAIFKEEKLLQGVHKLIKNFSLKTASSPTGVPFHSGAIKFFKSKGVM